MLQVVVPGRELYNSKTKEFIHEKDVTLNLEHSLISLSKWESQYKKPFLGTDTKTIEETIDYVRCMTLNPNVDPEIYRRLTDGVVKQVEAYIHDPMTATWINDQKNGPHKHQIVTSELIYYWMISLGIPFECQKWHLNRLLTLIRVCSAKNKQLQKPQKMSQRDIAERNAAINAARRKELNSRG